MVITTASFQKSYLPPANVTGSVALVSRLVDGATIEVRKTSSDNPHFLKQRLVDGEDIVSIWAENHPNLNHVAELGGRLKVRFYCPSNESVLPRFNEFSEQQILDFCQNLGVHPAHLIPFDSDPALTLPARLLSVLQHIAHPRSTFCREDKDLASVAIAFEESRVNSLYQKAHLSLDDQHQGLGRLMDVFHSVMNSPKGAGRLSLEHRLCREAVGEDGKRIYPPILRVRNIAYWMATREFYEREQAYSSKVELRDHWLDKIKHGYRTLINPQTSTDDDILYFLGDVKDALHELGTEAKAATMSQITSVLQSLLPPKNIFIEGYHASSGIRRYEQTYDDFLAEIAPEILMDLVVDLCRYFQIEADVSKSKLKTEKAGTDYNESMAKIYTVFRDSVLSTRQANLLSNWVEIVATKRDDLKQSLPLKLNLS